MNRIQYVLMVSAGNGTYYRLDFYGHETAKFHNTKASLVAERTAFIAFDWVQSDEYRGQLVETEET